jgi:predicted ArsR family transcriptional regulator
MDPDDAATLPPDLRAFLQACIESIEQVELLMMLRGSERLRTVREIAADLRITPAVARREVETLTARGLLEASVASETLYRYRPNSSELSRRGDLLAQYYVTSRLLIYKVVAASASRRSVKRFADAFKLRDSEK